MRLCRLETMAIRLWCIVSCCSATVFQRSTKQECLPEKVDGDNAYLEADERRSFPAWRPENGQKKGPGLSRENILQGD